MLNGGRERQPLGTHRDPVREEDDVMGNVLRSVLILGVVWLAMGGPQPSWAADPAVVEEIKQRATTGQTEE